MVKKKSWNVKGKKIPKKHGYHETLGGQVRKHKYKWDQYLTINAHKRRKKKDTKLKKKYRKQKRR